MRVKPWVVLSECHTPDGTQLQLCQRGHEFVLRAGGRVLMGSHQRGSEAELARLCLEALDAARVENARVLVGGLGFGFTLRAALDRVGSQAQVTVSELVPEVIVWNRGPLGACAAEPLADPRVEVALGDVKLRLVGETQRYDAILLDVDNGPRAFTQAHNAWLYSKRGLKAAHQALRDGGVLGLWSATPDAAFSARLHSAGFQSACHVVRSHSQRGERHVIWVAVKRTAAAEG